MHAVRPRRAAADGLSDGPPPKRRRFPAPRRRIPLDPPPDDGAGRSLRAPAPAASPAPPQRGSESGGGGGGGTGVASAAAAGTAEAKTEAEAEAEAAGGQRFQDVRGLEEHRVAGLPGGEVYYVPKFVSAETAGEWYASLVGLDSWYQPTLKMYGRSFPQSRRIAAYGEPGLKLKYSGQEVEMRYDWPAVLQDIRKRVEGMLGVEFNHVMLNAYADGSVYIGNHRDNFENRVIASVSVGAERTFVMSYAPLQNRRRRSEGQTREGQQDDGRVPKKRWVLGNGSVVVMQGDTQRFWKHEIPKEPKVKGGRISLTFRQLLS